MDASGAPVERYIVYNVECRVDIDVHYALSTSRLIDRSAANVHALISNLACSEAYTRLEPIMLGELSTVDGFNWGNLEPDVDMTGECVVHSRLVCFAEPIETDDEFVSVVDGLVFENLSSVPGVSFYKESDEVRTSRADV